MSITLVSLRFSSVSIVDFEQCLGRVAQWIEEPLEPNSYWFINYEALSQIQGPNFITRLPKTLVKYRLIKAVIRVKRGKSGSPIDGCQFSQEAPKWQIKKLNKVARGHQFPNSRSFQDFQGTTDYFFWEYYPQRLYNNRVELNEKLNANPVNLFNIGIYCKFQIIGVGLIKKGLGMLT